MTILEACCSENLHCALHNFPRRGNKRPSAGDAAGDVRERNEPIQEPANSIHCGECSLLRLEISTVIVKKNILLFFLSFSSQL